MHFNWLRQRLEKKKLLRVIRKIGRTERRKVDAQLHKLSKDIVKLAKWNDAIIVMGDLSGVGERSKSKGRKFRVKIARMLSYRMAQMTEYKAQWAGVLVFRIDEAWTTKTCHARGSIGRRLYQELFVCDCGLQYNADLNGAINIGRRFLGQLLGNIAFDRQLNFGSVMPSG